MRNLFPTGTRVRFRSRYEIYPHAIVQEGETGTVAGYDKRDDVYRVRLDQEHAGLAEWGNEAHWIPAHEQDPADYLERLEDSKEMVINQDTVDGAVERAQLAFWAEVHRAFPCEHGDLDPLTVHSLDVAQRGAVNSWLENNARRRYVVAVYDVTGCTREEEGAVAMEASVQGEASASHPPVEVQTATVAFQGGFDDLVDQLTASDQVEVI